MHVKAKHKTLSTVCYCFHLRLQIHVLGGRILPVLRKGNRLGQQGGTNSYKK